MHDMYVNHLSIISRRFRELGHLLLPMLKTCQPVWRTIATQADFECSPCSWPCVVTRDRSAEIRVSRATRSKIEKLLASAKPCASSRECEQNSPEFMHVTVDAQFSKLLNLPRFFVVSRSDSSFGSSKVDDRQIKN